MPPISKFSYAIFNYSFEIYDGLVNKKISLIKIYNLILEKNIDNIPKFKEISDERLEEIIKKYSRYDFLDDILFEYGNKYSHLKDIRDIVDLDNFIKHTITNELFLGKIRVIYMNKIIDKLLEKYYDYRSIKILSKFKESINIIDNRLDKKIMDNIRDYYVKKITV